MAGAVILIAVDKPADRDLFRRALAPAQHHLVFSRDGEEAYDRFNDVRPHLLIAHSDLIRMTGTELIGALRRQDGGAKLPMLLLLPPDTEKPAGFEAIHFPKPEIQLLEIIKGYLDPPDLDSSALTPISNDVTGVDALSEPSLPLLSAPDNDGPVLDEELPISFSHTQEVKIGVTGTDARIPGPLEEKGGVARGLDESQLGRRLSRRVRMVYERLETMDHYMLLGLSVEATPDDIERAFFDLSLEFHPDRFFLLKAGDLKEKIYQIYRRLIEANSVLTDPDQRKAYDAMMQISVDLDVSVTTSSLHSMETQQGSGDLSPLSGPLFTIPPDLSLNTPQARSMLASAVHAERSRDLDFARLWLHLAKVYEPDNSELKATIERLNDLIFEDRL